MTIEERERSKAIRHIVHEYANFVSSAEMILTGKDICGEFFKPPINTHISHAFYLNCRKLADFFENRGGDDDIQARHYVSGYKAALRVFPRWRRRINTQLTHLSYRRDKSARDIKARTQRALYRELRQRWRGFRRKLPVLYARCFVREIERRKGPHRNGQPSEFLFYDLD